MRVVRHAATTILLVMATATLAKPSGGQAAAAERGVADLLQRWSDAGEAQDWDAVQATYANAPGFAWIEQGEARYTSHAAIVAGLDAARRMKARIRNDVSEIVVTPLSADTAAFRARYLLDVAAEGFGYRSQGILSGVAVRRDGQWKFLQGAFSEQPAPRP